MSGVRRINIAAPAFTWDASDPEGFRSGVFRLGPGLQAEQTGATVYELPPGQAVCPYHYEHGEEEWALVLEGHPSLRTPAGTDRLDPFDVVFFPRGPDGAHGLSNGTGATVRLLMWSTVVYPTVTVYPDSDKVGVYTAGRVDDVIVQRSDAVDYFLGEGERPQDAPE